MSNPNTHLDWDNITDRYMAAMECNDEKTMRELASQIKISTGMALAAIQNMGKEAFLELGYDLSCVEKELGADWLERYVNKN
ncbi:hypothetical protein LJB93_02055 [Desulfovibrio sp. OttesenSCG-928-F07]|nr:hypothetical protein [Desulfovibrio sp. OttesenSCG-928-F07]